MASLSRGLFALPPPIHCGHTCDGASRENLADVFLTLFQILCKLIHKFRSQSVTSNCPTERGINGWKIKIEWIILLQMIDRSSAIPAAFSMSGCICVYNLSAYLQSIDSIRHLATHFTTG